MRLTPPDPPLVADTFWLRPWATTDAEALVIACQDPEIARWLPIPQPYTLESARQFIERAATLWSAGRDAQFTIVSQLKAGLLGSIALHVPEDSPASVGYWLASDARGRGIATEAVRLILGWAFDTIGLARVELYAQKGNVASQRVAERAGFMRQSATRTFSDSLERVVFELACDGDR